METLAERIKTIRANLTMSEFAQKLSKYGYKIDKGTISKYEKGTINPSYNFFQAMQKVFNVNLNWLITGDNQETDAIQPNSIKVYGSVQAGIPLEAWSSELFDISISHPQYSFLKKRDLFGFIVNGDSMMPRFRNNDLIITTKMETMPRDKDVVVVNFKSNIETSSGVVKIFYWVKKSKTDFILNSFNPYYPPSSHSLEDVINFFKVHLSISQVNYK